MHCAKHISLRHLLWRACLIAGILSLLGVPVALAASGALDTTFHGTGKYRFDIVAGQPGSAYAVAVQPDGKIVVLGQIWPSDTNGNIVVVRLTKAGALDTTFNGTGKRTTDLGGYDEASRVVLDPATGKIIVTGAKCASNGSNCDAAVLRFNPNGKPDMTFNGTGKRVDDFGGGDNGGYGGVALQADGKIVVSGYMANPLTHDYDFAVYRYTQAGTLDKTFAGTGKKAIGFGAGRQDFASSIAVQPDGKIVVVGTTYDASFSNLNFAIARLNANGTLDSTFSGDGKQTTNFGGNENARAVAIQPDGKIVVVGLKQVGSTRSFALARYKPNGDLDSTFAGTGKRAIDVSGMGQSIAWAVSIQPTDGKLVVCGESAWNMVVARFTTVGTLDTTFHGNGKAGIDFRGDDGCRGLAIQPDGKYVLAGSTLDTYMNRHWAVARVLP